MTNIIKVETPEQIADTAELAREIWTKHYIPIVGQALVDYMLENFQSEHAIESQLTAGYEYYLIIQNNENAGYIALVPNPEANELMISKLYVSKSVRGQGLGQTMLQFAEDICRERGLTTLWLTVNKNNAGSIKWYIRSGFRNAESIVQDIGNGFVMDDYRMEKTVV
ncbi:GNAT family N-acetyltransferase [Tichowtungia aerotolerans]|uniref:GNAT family N-acetyltransferase n=1 Tax=Tichowtungia aerotolerans TaxID=2697043 RepID=A0A6P1M965_9BACT|nr:GNAT family N-acetyltransferase [Tichowtungia aerotolerans]QHI70572.1 GNAT family N-acetyltransferase [Tichowtungia aerotolerans]